MQVAHRTEATGLLTQAELIVEESLCLNLRGRLIHCSRCEERCPMGALSLTPDSVEHDEMLCTGCNSCLPVCPAGALRSTGFVPGRFLQALSESDHKDLHCRASSSGGGGIVIPCYGVLDARLLAAARAEGVTELRLHGLEHCDGCQYGDARDHLRSVISQTADWLGESAPRLELEPGADEGGRGQRREYQDQPHMDRRSFLRFGGASGLSRAVDWLVPGQARDEEDAEALPFYQAGDHPQRAVPYQQAMVLRADTIPWREGGMLPLKTRRLGEQCSACLSCGKLCPSGAIEASETAQTRTLSFDPSLCTDCGLCVEICPHDAVIPEPLQDPHELRHRATLLVRRQQLCRQCQRPYQAATSEDGLCQVCRNEQDLDDAWLDMLSG